MEEKPNKKDVNFSTINWVSTAIAVILGFLALIGWIKESGGKDAIMSSVSEQTRKQWEIQRQVDKDIVKLQNDVEWIKKLMSEKKD